MTLNIEHYALKHTTQNKTQLIPSYSSASHAVQYFYHSYAFMLNHIDFFQYLNITRHIESQCQSFPPAGINSVSVRRVKEVFLERDLTVRPGLRNRILYNNQTNKGEIDAFTSLQCNANLPEVN